MPVTRQNVYGLLILVMLAAAHIVPPLVFR